MAKADKSIIFLFFFTDDILEIKGIIVFTFILHLFYLSSQIALTGYIFVIYMVTDQNIAFLVPDSCRATERNSNSISADVTDDAFENV